MLYAARMLQRERVDQAAPTGVPVPAPGHRDHGMSADRRCIGVEGRTCGASLPKRARKFCRRCRKIQERRRRARYNRDYFREHKDEIIAQRRNRRQELRDEKRVREQAERKKVEPKTAASVERREFLPAYELNLL